MPLAKKDQRTDDENKFIAIIKNGHKLDKLIMKQTTKFHVQGDYDLMMHIIM